MGKAKNDFIIRIRTLKTSITQTESVRSKGPSEREHNEIARMLRNGLAVVGFASLEDFIKQRCGEVLDIVGTVGLPFEKLPEKIQVATTHGAISALNYQIGLRDISEKISYVQEHAQKISSTSDSGYSLTPLAFGYGQANINSEMIKKILTSFNIDDPWKQITNIASSLGLAALPLNESFSNAAIRRHKAAHVANADTPQVDIDEFVNEAIAIAVGFDFLLSRALFLLKKHNKNYLNGSQKISANQVNYRMVKRVENKWKEFLSNKPRAYRSTTELEVLVSDAKSRAINADQFFIHFDENGLIVDWHC